MNEITVESLVPIAEAEAKRYSRFTYLRSCHDDLVQEGLIKMWLMLPKLDMERTPSEQRAFLGKTASSACLSWLRKNKRWRSESQRGDVAELAILPMAPLAPSAEDCALAHEIWEKLIVIFRQAEARMTPSERAYFLSKLGVEPLPTRMRRAERSTLYTFGARARAKLVTAAEQQGCDGWLNNEAFVRLLGR